MEGLMILAAGLASTVLTAIPVVRILRRTGFSGWLAFVALVPLLNIVALWAFAFSEWPSEVVNAREQDKWSPADNEAFKQALAKQKR
jgi:uncharacterized membrane protein YhaH (DUF805 family)